MYSTIALRRGRKLCALFNRNQGDVVALILRSGSSRTTVPWQPAHFPSKIALPSAASAALIGTVLGNAVNASVFEVPIILQTRRTGEFEKALYGRLESPGLVKMPGLIAGLLAFAFLT